MLYFAYGSNLHKDQMSRRCPAAEPLGKLIMPNTRLVFRGVADVVRADGVDCPGGIWRITAECERALDRYEGFRPEYPDGGMYSKEYVELDGLPDGEAEIMLYTMNSIGIYPPSAWYFDTLKQGYRDFGLPQAPLRAALEHSYDEQAPLAYRAQAHAADGTAGARAASGGEAGARQAGARQAGARQGEAQGAHRPAGAKGCATGQAQRLSRSLNRPTFQRTSAAGIRTLPIGYATGGRQAIDTKNQPRKAENRRGILLSGLPNIEIFVSAK